MTSLTSSPLDDARGRRWGNFALYAALAVGGFFIAPFVMTAIGGILGTAAALALIGTIFWALPIIQMKAANLRLCLIKHEAASNPVLTLQEEHRRQSVQLEGRKAGIEKMDGAIRTLHQTIDQLEADFPDSPELPQMKSDEADLRGLLASRNQDWQDAFVSLGDFAKEIQRVSRLWDVSLAAAAARQQSGLSQEEWLGKMKTQTAIDAVRNKLNEQLASLNTEKMESDAQRILKGKQAAKATINVTPAQAALPAASEANVIDVTPLHTATPLRRKASLT